MTKETIMKKNQRIKQSILPCFSSIALVVLISTSIQAQDQIAPPDVNVIDEFGVNVASGQVMAKVHTVSIGGGLGFNHSLTIETNHFAHRGSRGDMDKYTGNAKYISIGSDIRFDIHGPKYHKNEYGDIWVMRVFGPEGSEDFMIMVGTEMVLNHGDEIQDNYTYRALGDTRNTLVESPNRSYLIWTTPNGTQLNYKRVIASTDANDGGQLNKITYPNGRIIHYHGLDGLTTNTGYQLKYEYSDVGSLSPDKDIDLSGTRIPSPYPLWLSPSSITGFNRAYKYCSTDYEVDCDNGDWPNASMTWPGGMPTAFHIGESVFSVNNADGGITDFHYQAFDVCTHPSSGTYAEGCTYPEANKWSPRLTGIKTASSNVVDRTFIYKNDGRKLTNYSGGTIGIHGEFTFWRLDSISGVIVEASGVNGSAGYSDEPAHGGPDRWKYNGRGVGIEMSGEVRGRRKKVDTEKQGTYRYEENYRNFIREFDPISGPTKNYTYDGRGNLIKIETHGDTTTSVEASYPEECVNPKTCNQPTWLRDAKGKQTDFTYHADSGMVATVTSPAGGNGVRAKTTNIYQAFYAYYKKNSEAIVQADSPVWLLTKESHCRATAATANGCNGGVLDEIKTEYYYGPQQSGTANNLFLRGVMVTAKGSSGQLETRTTCHQYDKYGNQIGSTLPKGNVNFSSCL